MVRPPAEFVEAARSYVCVRVVDMRKVDLDVYRFDFDLTLAILLMNGDGTIYHRYGGRDAASPLSWMSMGSLVRLMRDTLGEHVAYAKNPSPPPQGPRRTIMELEPFARKVARKDVDCVHCHMIHPAEREARQESRRWEADDIWLWPAPDKVGLALDPEDQSLVRSVLGGSTAESAGLRAGDRLLDVGEQRIGTITDLQAVLERTPKGDAVLPFRFRRGEAEQAGRLELKSGWKRGSPLDFSWRPSKWELRPGPGFGGKALTEEEKSALGLDPKKLAVKVGYLIDWGEDAALGRSAAKAGLRKGDVVVAVAGADDLTSEAHFQAWFRLTRKAGETVELQILREGKRLAIALPVLP